MKLGQILSVAEIAVGFGVNDKMLEQVGMSAHWAYRERFLRDEGCPFSGDQHSDADPGRSDEDGEVISVVQLAEDEGLELPD